MDLIRLLVVICMSSVHVQSYEHESVWEYIESTSGYMFLRNIIQQSNLTYTLSQGGILFLYFIYRFCKDFSLII